MSDSLLEIQKDILQDNSSTSHLGARGERLAADHLRRRGFTIVATNFKVPVGRNRRGARVTGEIDIIALDRDVLCFVEVKTRSGSSAADPLDAIDPRKQRQIARTALVYKRLFGLERMPHRFDAVGITHSESRAPMIRHVPGHWTDR